MKVLITGATGLIGKHIIKLCLDSNYEVNYLTTSKSKLNSIANCNGFHWNPKNNTIDHKCLDGVDAIINLVGATISKRWTVAYKTELLNSRTQTAMLLQQTIKEHAYTVSHVVSASAIGIYPSDYEVCYTETHAEVSESFLGEVVKQWEAAVNEFEALGCKVSKIRIGLVLSEKGGALPEIVRPIRFSVGSAFGSGKQWQSWIHIEDLAKIFMFVLEQKQTGIFNAVAPNAVNNSEFTKTIAKVLKKPLFLPNVPKFMMKLVLGEMHTLLFESQYVSSDKIEKLGFQFTYPNLTDALNNLLAS